MAIAAARAVALLEVACRESNKLAVPNCLVSN